MGSVLQARGHPNAKGQNDAARLAEGERMLDDRALGMKTSQLMEKYDVSKATLYRRLDDALKARLAVTVDAYREQQNAALDLLMSKWNQHLEAADEMIRQAETAGPDGGPHLGRIDIALTHRSKALDSMLRVLERRARLNGADAPLRADVTVTVTTPVDAAVEALVADIESRVA